MTSPQIPSSSGKSLSITPGSRVLKTPLSDESMWKRLKEAGFDEESIRKRDKAALIGYIAKLEAEIFDYQHHMGMLLLEKKEMASKYEQDKAYAEEEEARHRRDQAVYVTALADARKGEEGLKKALAIEKECIVSLEKALHEIRAETAETKVAAETKLATARTMMEEGQKKHVEGEVKLHAAEALQAEASRYHRTADRKLKEVEAREEDLTRRIASFKSECDLKEKEMMLERQSLGERQKSLQQEQERLLDAQTSLNQREDYIVSRTQELIRLEKEVEAIREGLELESKTLRDEKSAMEATLASLSKREEAVFEREALLHKKEQELLVSQGRLASKETEEIQRVIANQENILKKRSSEFESELEKKRKVVEDEIETKRRSWEIKEVDFVQREDLISEKEHELEVQSRVLADKTLEMTEKLNLLDGREKILSASEIEIEVKKTLLEKEKEDIHRMKLDLEKSLVLLEDQRKQVDSAQEKLQTLKCAEDEKSILEMKLKEELDATRAMKREIMAEEDKLKAEKAMFEAEWEFIDEKKEELRKEAEHVGEEREALSKFLRDERDSLREERDALRDQHRRDIELLNREREELMNKMSNEHSEWLSKIQQERAEFLLSTEVQKRELESCIERRREELEGNLKEKERAFEEEKKSELQYIRSLKEMAEKELEQVAIGIRRLDAERMEIKLDRERRDREWAELNDSIEELKLQREKLEKQRELLRADREGIHAEVEELKKLEDVKVALDDMSMVKMQLSSLENSRRKLSSKRYLRKHSVTQDVDSNSQRKVDSLSNGNGFDSPSQKPSDSAPSNSTPISWIKRITGSIFKNPTEQRLLYRGHSANGKLENSSSERRYTKSLARAELENQVDESGKSTSSDFEQRLQGGRKRGIDNSNASDSVDPSSMQMQNNNSNNKRMRQQQDVNLHASEEVSNHSNSALHGDQLELMTTNQTRDQKNQNQTSVVIVDKIVEISQVTCEITSVRDTPNKANIGDLQNPVAESDLDGTLLGNDVSFETKEIIQEETHQASVCLADENNQELGGGLLNGSPCM